MNRLQLLRGSGLTLAVFGTAIAVGGLLTSVGIPTGISEDSIIVGAGIAVAGAGATMSFGNSSEGASSEEPAVEDPAPR